MTGGLAAEPGSNARNTILLLKYRICSALERVSGMPYLAWQRERILEPLQMYRTCFDPDPSISHDLAVGYAVGEDGKIDRLPGCLGLLVDIIPKMP